MFYRGYLLPMIPWTVGRLGALRELRIEQCPSLTNLPESLGDLTQLQRLVIQDCQLLRTIPESLGRLQRAAFEFLVQDADQALRMIEAPYGLDSIPRISAEGSTPMPVENLSIKRCEFEELPRIVGQLEKLQVLFTPCCTICTKEGRRRTEESLELSRCSHFQILPSALGDLKCLEELEIDSCSNLVTLPDEIGHLTKLQSLTISSCRKFFCLPTTVGKLASLTHLDTRLSDEILDLPEELGEMDRLESIYIQECQEFRWLPTTFGSLRTLEELNVHDCPKLQSFPQGMDQMTNLTEIFCKSVAKNPDNVLNMSLPPRLRSFVAFEEEEWKAIPKARLVGFLKKNWV